MTNQSQNHPPLKTTVILCVSPKWNATHLLPSFTTFGWWAEWRQQLIGGRDDHMVETLTQRDTGLKTQLYRPSGWNNEPSSVAQGPVCKLPPKEVAKKVFLWALSCAQLYSPFTLMSCRPVPESICILITPPRIHLAHLSLQLPHLNSASPLWSTSVTCTSPQCQ